MKFRCRHTQYKGEINVKYIARFTIVLLVCLIFLNNPINKEYKLMAEVNNVEVENLEQFIDNFSIIPEEVKKYIDNQDKNLTNNKQETKINSVFEEEEFTVTAYDLSVQSCGKKITSRGYGITRNGFDLRGHTWKTARVIAVDPKVIPLGSIVYIQFIDEDYFNYNGVYIAEDTGSAIKGNKIDLFFEDTGEKVSGETMDFGVTKARIIILNKDGGM
jgi:3D (Asp-Asp-Asp) domain-containing protein